MGVLEAGLKGKLIDVYDLVAYQGEAPLFIRKFHQSANTVPCKLLYPQLLGSYEYEINAGWATVFPYLELHQVV